MTDPGSEATPVPPAALPMPIAAPPAPRKFRAPHNLYSAYEVVDVLTNMQAGSCKPFLPKPDRPADSVLVFFKNESHRTLRVREVLNLQDVEDVVRIHVNWNYQDGSNVSGTLIDRPLAAHLEVQQEGLALAATRSALQQLEGIRPHRARLHGFIGRHGLRWLLGVALVLVALGPAFVDVGVGVGVGVVILWLALVIALNGLVTVAERRFGGTRLAPESRLNRSLWQSQEAMWTCVAALTGIVGVIVTVLKSGP